MPNEINCQRKKCHECYYGFRGKVHIVLKILLFETRKKAENQKSTF